MPYNFLHNHSDFSELIRIVGQDHFISIPEYLIHKKKRFRSGDNLVIAENEAFLLSNTAMYQEYERAYQETYALYYKEQPEFSDIMKMIQSYMDKL
ncbi:MAG: hypothetical protein KAJ40_08290 [Alphaproteobacteria bacterium]|nr:hypothetical protein [Alphaproteobacteria bacterium]